MAEFVWEAKGRNGEVRKGVMEAESADVVQSRLRGQQLNPTKVKKKPKEIHINIGSPVSEKELVIFTRQFATMIDAGLPLVQCLDILSDQGDNKQFNKILKDIKGYVEQGGTFSEALRKHPKVFDDLYVNLVHAGEMGGILDTILQRLAIYIEKRVKLKRQVKGAMVYPTAVLLIAIAVIVVMLTWVIPAFQGMFAEFGGEDQLPGLTKMVISLSEGFLDNVWFIIAGVVLLVSSVSYSYRTKKGKRFWHKLLLTAPIIGPVMRKIAVARFTRTLGTLLGSGVPILDSMTIVSRASGNVIVEEAINKTADRIREGKTMSEPLMQTGVFPGMVVQMIGVGEQTGALDTMLNKIADFYEEEVDVAVAALTSLLEPLMMVVIGGIVGVILIAMYMPIFEIAGKIQAG
ncbi:MAG TPA: type II secretion system F family protein [Polyangiaceae bacterium LLY-WYZ-15_(1-7)]|nr:pilus assembly protein PilC [Myxococcales bacterium]MBJ73150.1 pilus assembly protein PilC [Sandaracinus sp.]HJK91066.1 type II secretion system F family protein [Polyangiaceae bacterium LLY-WYZ-15_(1-7)]HJL01348.1 type II secretion system F family protein [Polyangiaceae bacterium LLY-WYZ-15_(1-7)]HJL10611.1 type II secretion system F family protein [Polyangiaceae bacterium LLY-WYZ-15_(1-7)]